MATTSGTDTSESLKRQDRFVDQIPFFAEVGDHFVRSMGGAHSLAWFLRDVGRIDCGGWSDAAWCRDPMQAARTSQGLNWFEAQVRFAGYRVLDRSDSNTVTQPASAAQRAKDQHGKCHAKSKKPRAQAICMW